MDGLPAGVAADPVSVPAAVDSATLVLVASSSAQEGGPVPVRVHLAAEESALAERVSMVSLLIAGSPGSVDRSFGTDGRVPLLSGVGELELADVAVAADGSITTMGQRLGEAPEYARTAFLVRLTADGERDASFGDGGLVYDNPSAYETTARSLILVDGEARALMMKRDDEDHVAGIQFLAGWDDDGALDSGFASRGVVQALGYDSGYDSPRGLVFGDGRYFYGSFSALYAFDPAGAHEAISVPDGYLAGLAMVHQNGRITSGQSGPDAAVGRIHDDGRWDTEFGDGGVLRVDSIAADPDGVVGIAIALEDDGSGFALVRHRGAELADVPELIRFTADGRLDDSFGDGGRVRLADRGWPSDVFIDRQHRPVVRLRVATSEYRSESQLRRYTRSGTLDTTFGDGGMFVESPLLDAAGHDSVADRVVTCGYADYDRIACTRLWL
ncbi:MAG: hypothetical protein JJ863_38455 [Deltaproteobacteria bacterium]|nr:hypothetical protein [Deltaproteobacteria bacterium]